MLQDSRPRWPVLAQLWWIIEQQRRRRDGASTGTTPVAPGLVTLNPQPDGVHYTMPAMPAGAGGMRLQKRDSHGVWKDCRRGMANLGGGATGIDISGVYGTRYVMTFDLGGQDAGITPGYYPNMPAQDLGGGQGLVVNVLINGSGACVGITQTDDCWPSLFFPGSFFAVDMGSGLAVYATVSTRVIENEWVPFNGYDFDGKAVDYRAVNVNGGLAGPAASTTTSALPAAATVTVGNVRPAAGSPTGFAQIPVTAPGSYPARGLHFYLNWGPPLSGAANTFAQEMALGETYNFDCRPDQCVAYNVDGTWYIALRSWNNYGGTPGNLATKQVTTSGFSAPLSAPSIGGTH